MDTNLKVKSENVSLLCISLAYVINVAKRTDKFYIRQKIITDKKFKNM